MISAQPLTLDHPWFPDVTTQGDQTQVRDLTSTAVNCLARGAVEDAFDSLLLAYLIDPTAPEVLACERQVIPVWEHLRGTSLRPHALPSAQTSMNGSLFERLKQGRFLK